MTQKRQTPKIEDKKIKTVEKVHKSTLIYCGPSFPGELEQYTILKNGVPKHAEKHIKKCPTINKLFVGLKEFPSFKKKIKTNGKKENQLFNKVLEYQKEVIK